MPPSCMPLLAAYPPRWMSVPLFVIIVDKLCANLMELLSGFWMKQVNAFVFKGSKESLDENIVNSPAFPIH